MATIIETVDAAGDPLTVYSNYNITSGDTFQGAFGFGDGDDRVNANSLLAGETYSFSLAVDNWAGTFEFALYNPANFDAFRVFADETNIVHVTPGSTSFGQFTNFDYSGGVLSFDFTPDANMTGVIQVMNHTGSPATYLIDVAVADPYGITGGDDDVTGLVGVDDVNLLNGDDTFSGGEGDDIVQGANGNDSIFGDSGNDLLNGGGNDDVIDGGTGRDTLLGGVGNDGLFGGSEADQINGGDGNDTIDAGTGDDNVIGGKGDDFILGGDGADDIEGGFGNDTMDGGAGADVFHVIANNGNDVVQNFFVGVDRIDVNRIGVSDISDMTISDDGTDTTIDFGGGNTMVLPGVLSTSLSASNFIMSPSAVTLTGTAGKDQMVGSGSADIMSGLNGNDQMFGYGNDDVMAGGGRNDRLWGGNGNDDLSGDNGNDRLWGEAGDDTLNGGKGKDILTGGSGADIFEFDVKSNADVITDFENGIDMIDLSALAGAGITGFGDLAIQQVGADVLIALAAGSSITLSGTAIGDIDSSDFLF